MQSFVDAVLVAPGFQDLCKVLLRQDQSDAVVVVGEAPVVIHLPQRQLLGIGCRAVGVSLPCRQSRCGLGQDLQAAKYDGHTPEQIVAQAGDGRRRVRPRCALALMPGPARIIQPQLLGVESDILLGIDDEHP